MRPAGTRPTEKWFSSKYPTSSVERRRRRPCCSRIAFTRELERRAAAAISPTGTPVARAVATPRLKRRSAAVRSSASSVTSCRAADRFGDIWTLLYTLSSLSEGYRASYRPVKPRLLHTCGPLYIVLLCIVLRAV